VEGWGGNRRGECARREGEGGFGSSLVL